MVAYTALTFCNFSPLCGTLAASKLLCTFKDSPSKIRQIPLSAINTMRPFQMNTDLSLSWDHSSTVHTDWTLHQIAPYIGRMKAAMARSLIEKFTRPGDLVVDPFCGSGVVPLEASASKRRVAAGDWSPYAYILTKAKLIPPPTLNSALSRFETIWKSSRRILDKQDLRTVPKWVRSFFHPETLRSTLAFRDACVYQQEHFLLACLLGILHHQRPGFLSYPSSHLVPYLRNLKFPRTEFPELYMERDVKSRMLAKIVRTYKRFPIRTLAKPRVSLVDARSFPRMQGIHAVITSPPYMNELDYVRDNRLRLWFIERSLPAGLELGTLNKKAAFTALLSGVCSRLAPMIRSKGVFALVLGDATRGGQSINTATIAKQVFSLNDELNGFELIAEYRDKIPDIRRSRRECKGTKAETILVYRNQ